MESVFSTVTAVTPRPETEEGPKLSDNRQHWLQQELAPGITNRLNAELEKKIRAAVTRLVGTFLEESLPETLPAMEGPLIDTRMEMWIAEGVEGPIGKACHHILPDLVTANLVSTKKENPLVTQKALVDDEQSPETPPSHSQVVLPEKPKGYATLGHIDPCGGPSVSSDSKSDRYCREGGHRGKKQHKEKKSEWIRERKKKSRKSSSISSRSWDESDLDSSSGEDRRRRRSKSRIERIIPLNRFFSRVVN